MNALTLAFYAAGLAGVRWHVALPSWAVLLLLGAGIINIICLVAIFWWRKWGLWGLTIMAVAIFVLNISLGINPVRALLGLAGPLILFAVLNIGGANKGWNQLS